MTCRMSHRDVFAEVLHVVLHKPEAYGELREGMQRWHAVFHELTSISGEHLNRYQHTMLPSGKAISPASAAACLIDFQRTAVFLRGIVKAIRHLQARFPGERLRILYAGTGPYATLLTPLTVLFSAGELCFDMLDIHQESIDAVKTLYAKLGITAYLGDLYVGDATTHQLHPETHMVLSETMLAGLRSEMQVPIMLHLIPQMREGALFLPEEIRVTAAMLSHRLEVERIEGKLSEPPQRMILGEIYRIGMRHCLPPGEVTLHTPDLEEGWRMYLMTEIDVFAEEGLRAYQSSLTIPERVRGEFPSGSKVRFGYRVAGAPGFVPLPAA